MAYDSPLALVVGAHLVATKLIHPKILNNADEFRRRLLEGFRDAITGTIGLPNEAALIRGTLELIAGMNIIRLSAVVGGERIMFVPMANLGKIDIAKMTAMFDKMVEALSNARAVGPPV